jgi:hypothetical protein
MFVNQLKSKNLKTQPTLFMESLFMSFQDQSETPLLSGNFKTKTPLLSGKILYYGQEEGKGYFFFFFLYHSYFLGLSSRILKWDFIPLLALILPSQRLIVHYLCHCEILNKNTCTCHLPALQVRCLVRNFLCE